MATRERVRESWTHRRLAGFAAALVLVFVVQAGLFPFNFTTHLPVGNPRVLFATVTHDLVVPDILSNIVLYVPVGLCVVWFAYQKSRGRFTALLAALIIGVITSATVEYAQAYLPSRVSSAIDLTANVIGTVLGGIIALTARWAFPRSIDALYHEFRTAPATAVAKLYVLALIIAASVPFTFTFDATRFFRSVREAHLVPFASLTETHPITLARSSDSADGVIPNLGDERGMSRNPARDGAYAAWERYRLGARWLAESVSFLLLGLLLFASLRGDFRFSRGAAFGLTIWIGTGLSLVLSGLPLFLTTRRFDTTDILARLFGLGLAFGMIALARSRVSDDQSTGLPRPSWIVRRSPLLVTAFIVFLGLIPFSFDWSAERFMQSITSVSFLPFASYDAARFDVMLADLFEKLSTWSLFAFCMAHRRAALPHASVPSSRSRGALFVATVGQCIALSALLELAQLFSPVRTASLTDPIVAGIGAGLGIAIQRQCATLFARVAMRDTTQPVKQHRVNDSQALSPTDELISSLTQEYQGAPIENAPERSHTRIP